MRYKELKDKATKSRANEREKANRNYHYARSKGFTSRESTLLQYKTTEEIDSIAAERDKQEGGE